MIAPMRAVLFAAVLVLELVLSGSQTFAAELRRHWKTPDWQSYSVCPPAPAGGNASGDHATQPCLEIIKLKYSSNTPRRGVALLVPGFFQNGAIFDLLPKQGISFARSLMKENNLQVYFLHVRGIGNSDKTSGYDLDDIAAEDIPLAIEYVYKLEKEKILLIGHSQGGITAKAALAGLTHCEKGFCFRQAESDKRQAMVQGVLSIAANASMSTRYSHSGLRATGKLGWLLHSITRKTIDYIPASELTRRFSGIFSAAYCKFWKFLYSVPQVTRAAKKALYKDTLDGSSSALLNQYSEAIAHNGIRDSVGEFYEDALVNLHIPVAEAAFELDSLSPPKETYEDTYLKLNQDIRNYYYFAGQRHEDFMIIPELNNQFSEAIKWLMEKQPPSKKRSDKR